MFGTLRLNQESNSVDFIERADGKAFCEAGNIIPPHSACVRCRAKRLRCDGQKPLCFRCKSFSLECTYAAVEGNTDRRRGHASGQKRNHSGEIIPSTSSSTSVACRKSAQVTPSPHLGADDQRRSSSSSSGYPSSPISTRPTTQNGTQMSNGASHVGVLVRGPQDSTNECDTYLDPNLLHATLHANSNDAELSFFAGETIGSIESSMVNLAGDTHEYDESLTSTDFNVGLATSWSFSSTKAFPFPDAQGPATTSDLTSYPSSQHAHEASTPFPISSRSQAQFEQKTLQYSNQQCDDRCLFTITPLLEEIEDRMQNMKPPRLEGVLRWQKNACRKCIQVLRCRTCYPSSEHMMLLIMFCDKLIMLTQKLLSHTTDKLKFQGSYSMRDYEVSDPNEMLGLVHLLSGLCVRSIGTLLSGIKASPGVEGRQVQLVLIRNIEQQVERTMSKTKESIILLLEQGFSDTDKSL
ncbi:hypothetical protein E0Z10_g3716 [Xylaria hypoxylon]|uniref:Zn(2)-C6 fungal-type domain-containing protein n=1 Tax=Xylaria hypoxylon TaxID=37992 RepID=A0A4Z0Z2K3_9PEZI|nr:hypothetical protein E0Z10_g3716 [Xylaria hypoxylon]